MGIHTEVIDVQPVLVPKQNDSTNTGAFGYIILVDDNQWGIASEQIREIVSIPKKEVNWRSADNDKRPWFKGIVNSKMSSILDINALISALQSK
jgi:chemotaxis signal transduction protein